MLSSLTTMHFIHTASQCGIDSSNLASEDGRSLCELPHLNLNELPALSQKLKLLPHFGKSLETLDKYIGNIRRINHKSNKQLNLLFELLLTLPFDPGNGPKHFGKDLVHLGLFDEVTYNACSVPLLEILCQPDILLYAFERSNKLRTVDDFSKHWVKYDSENYRKAYSLGKDAYNLALKYTELDHVLLHFSDRIAEKGFITLRLAQRNKENIISKKLFKDPNPSPDGEPSYDFSPRQVKNYPKLLGSSFERFMSKEQLKIARIEKKSPWKEKYMTNGAFYQLAFKKHSYRPCTII
ncbi:hypothetical protein FNU76_01560 [Chitinimonas arctica]|uniref:Uncharacterized protein n=1 Tax=Chitinimonas arctica TaxID=2594795 RepID=A0A516SAH3_9NEIS|nr:hypothetical protein [Chitinimonas arctica]QDQ25147.1 hypothetical protein FNU76_01560 [Chitinimonas arctica]